VYDVLPLRSAARLMTAVRETLATGAPVAVRTEVPGPGPAMRQFDVCVTASGPEEAVGVARRVDAPEPRRLSTEDRGRPVRVLAEHLLEAVVVLDEAGLIVDALGILPDALGYRIEELVGTPALRYAHPDDAEAATTILARVPVTGRPERFVLRGVHKDGSTRWFEGVAVIVTDEGRGQTIVNLRDATAQVELEEQFHQAQKMEAIGRLAGGVAHDVNNILTVINGYAEMVGQRVVAGTELADAVDEILRAGRRATVLIDQVLAVSRRTPTSPHDVDVAAALRDLEDTLRRVVAQRAELRVEAAVDAGFVRLGHGQLEQIVLNLVYNSLDAMPDGGRIVVRAWSEAADGGDAAAGAEGADGAEGAGARGGSGTGRVVHLSVEDTGAGIPPDVLERVFEPFFTTKPPGRGTGLGLATVHDIVTRHGGRVTAHSEPGAGCRIDISLPARAAARPDTA
jgi:PAS domain S-box-containing protein